MTDKLNELFDLQSKLNKRVGVDTDNMNDEDKVKWVLNYTRAMQQEMSELIDSVPWKWWAKYQEFDQQNAKVEVVDLFHFAISLAQVLGLRTYTQPTPRRIKSTMTDRQAATPRRMRTTQGTSRHGHHRDHPVGLLHC